MADRLPACRLRAWQAGGPPAITAGTAVFRRTRTFHTVWEGGGPFSRIRTADAKYLDVPVGKVVPIVDREPTVDVNVESATVGCLEALDKTPDSYQLSELTGRMGCKAACMGSARASRAVPCAPRGTPGVHRHSERLGSPRVFREGAEYGTRVACAPPTTPSCFFSPYSQSPYF